MKEFLDPKIYNAFSNTLSVLFFLSFFNNSILLTSVIIFLETFLCQLEIRLEGSAGTAGNFAGISVNMRYIV